MANTHGGARPGSGPKKGFGKIRTVDLQAAIENKIGMSVVDILADTYDRLYLDFKEKKNIPHFLAFQENMNKRMLLDADKAPDDEKPATVAEIDAKLNALLAKQATQAIPQVATLDSTNSGEITGTKPE